MKAASKMEGSYAIGVISAKEPDKIIAVRKDSPLIVGVGKDEYFIASDIPAVLSSIRDVYLLNDNEFVVMTMDGVTILSDEGEKIEKEIYHVTWNVDAGVVGKYVIEKLARILEEVNIASEFRYRDPIIDEKTLMLVISQSGETADTLAALRLAKANNTRVLAITNVVGSSVSREADDVLYTWAGPEIAVASTKAYATSSKDNANTFTSAFSNSIAAIFILYSDSEGMRC